MRVAARRGHGRSASAGGVRSADTLAEAEVQLTYARRLHDESNPAVFFCGCGETAPGRLLAGDRSPGSFRGRLPAAAEDLRRGARSHQVLVAGPRAADPQPSRALRGSAKPRGPQQPARADSARWVRGRQRARIRVERVEGGDEAVRVKNLRTVKLRAADTAPPPPADTVAPLEEKGWRRCWRGFCPPRQGVVAAPPHRSLDHAVSRSRTRTCSGL